VVAFVLVLALAASALAQDIPNPAANARLRIGPAAISPRFGLTNLGVDNNIFNEPDQLEPKSDFTFTVTPAADIWLRLGRAWLAATVVEDLVYYQEYESERAANNRSRIGLLVPLNRLTLNLGGTYIYARDRPGFEIDARSQRTELGYSASVEVRALSKTFFGARGERNKVEYDKDQVFLGSSLYYELNRTVSVAALTLRHTLTPLTAIMADFSVEQDRFEFSPTRDADSWRIAGGVKFEPFALMTGAASIGYRDFRPTSPEVPVYQGTIATVDLSSTPISSMKLTLQAARDVQYSYEINQPYYVQTGVTASIAQQIYGPVDIVARIGAQKLAYRDRVGAVVDVPNQVDRVRLYGGGFGYRMGRDVRIGFNIDQQRRESPVVGRAYSAMRFGFSVTYGS
jgi:hypothetical protein